MALPVYFVTKSKSMAIILSTLSGLAEPLGVVAVMLLNERVLSERVVSCMLAGVAGVMISISLLELLPVAFQYCGWKQTLRSFIASSILMLTILTLLNLAGL